MHPLDNPIWSALTTQQSHIAIGGELARRFPLEKAPFVAFSSASKESFDALAQLYAPGDQLALFTPAPSSLMPPGLPAASKSPEAGS